MLDFSDRTRTGISILTSAADYKVPFIAQILDPFDVTLSEFVQKKKALFAHVIKAQNLRCAIK